ncbi:hypothetical protein VNO78_13249 [Psophocarpus tetragonolobus]|uniref:Peptidase A1 domain-containing protein n=1 Tax=Psophocarpus tetragonolobus TaxID=3891 RepID=A0AAN9SQY2_PSOTE
MSVPCNSQTCTLLRRHSCANSGACEYIYSYGDKSFTSGGLATETINFGDQGVTFPNSFFGCGTYNVLTPSTNGKMTGLVGLGAGKLSLVSQIGDKIGHKFSYCLLPFTSSSTSKLIFGDEAIIKGNGVESTPLIIKPSFPSYYFLNLEAITVGQKSVPTGQNDGNIIIDSGTTLTFLEPSFHNKFVSLVKEALGVEEEPNPPSPFNFCFRYKEGMNLTNIVFEFKGAKVALSPKNLFLQLDTNLLCLAIVPTNQPVSIFGNVAQIDFQVEYDLEGKKVSFAPTDCSRLG